MVPLAIVRQLEACNGVDHHKHSSIQGKSIYFFFCSVKLQDIVEHPKSSLVLADFISRIRFSAIAAKAVKGKYCGYARG